MDASSWLKRQNVDLSFCHPRSNIILSWSILLLSRSNIMISRVFIVPFKEEYYDIVSFRCSIQRAIYWCRDRFCFAEEAILWYRDLFCSITVQHYDIVSFRCSVQGAIYWYRDFFVPFMKQYDIVSFRSSVKGAILWYHEFSSLRSRSNVMISWVFVFPFKKQYYDIVSFRCSVHDTI